MKRLLLGLSLLVLSQGTHAQLHQELKDTNWYIAELDFEGVTYPSPLINMPVVEPNIDFEETMAFAVVDPDSDSFFSDVTYDPTEFEFTFINPAITLPGCQQYCDFAIEYFQFLFGDGENVLFSYIIDITDSGGLFLTIFDEAGNYAFYWDRPVLGVNDFAQSQFRIYPNPTSDLLFISSERSTKLKITIYNSVGQLLLSQVDSVGRVDVSALIPGIYFVEITSEDGKTVQKFIKE